MALITSDCGAMRSPSIKWPVSPRVVVQRAPRASNGPYHLGLCALQVEIKQHLEAVDRRLASVEMEKTTTLVSALRFMQHTLWAIARYDGPNHLGLFPSTVFMWRIMDYRPT